MNGSMWRHILHVGTDVVCQLVGSPLGFVELPGHTGGDGNEVQVVAVVHHGIDTLHSTGLDVSAVGGSSLLVGLDGRVVIAGADIDMRGHVHQVPGRWRQRGQSVSAGQRTIRVG